MEPLWSPMEPLWSPMKPREPHIRNSNKLAVLSSASSYSMIQFAASNKRQYDGSAGSPGKSHKEDQEDQGTVTPGLKTRWS